MIRYERKIQGPYGNGLPCVHVCVLILGTIGFMHDHIYLMLTKSSCGVELERDESESQRDCC